MLVFRKTISTKQYFQGLNGGEFFLTIRTRNEFNSFESKLKNSFRKIPPEKPEILFFWIILKSIFRQNFDVCVVHSKKKNICHNRFL